MARAESLCGEGVEIIPWEMDDAWMRDIGPNFVKNEAGELAASIFHFNAWGRKYTWYRKDAAVGHRLAEALGVRTFSSPVYMEGGGINTDGEGTLLTTEQCILNPNRNPGISREEAEHELCEALGLDKVIWLKGDPAGMTRPTDTWTASPASCVQAWCWARSIPAWSRAASARPGWRKTSAS